MVVIEHVGSTCDVHTGLMKGLLNHPRAPVTELYFTLDCTGFLISPRDQPWWVVDQLIWLVYYRTSYSYLPKMISPDDWSVFYFPTNGERSESWLVFPPKIMGRVLTQSPTKSCIWIWVADQFLHRWLILNNAQNLLPLLQGNYPLWLTSFIQLIGFCRTVNHPLGDQLQWLSLADQFYIVDCLYLFIVSVDPHNLAALEFCVVLNFGPCDSHVYPHHLDLWQAI